LIHSNNFLKELSANLAKKVEIAHSKKQKTGTVKKYEMKAK
jgi:hypothetical protein